jgi:hypothetical protein
MPTIGRWVRLRQGSRFCELHPPREPRLVRKGHERECRTWTTQARSNVDGRMARFANGANGSPGSHYDFCRAHSNLRVTPAMEAGITDYVWSLGGLCTTVREVSQAA